MDSNNKIKFFRRIIEKKRDTLKQALRRPKIFFLHGVLLILIDISERKRPRGQRDKGNSWPDWLEEGGGAEREEQPAARCRSRVEGTGSSSPAGPAAPGAALCCPANPAGSAREEGIAVAFCHMGRRQTASPCLSSCFTRNNFENYILHTVTWSYVLLQSFQFS